MTVTATAEPANSGLFISFEGGDGSGKTTQIELLADWFREHGHEVLATREPGGTELGKQVRQLILHGEDMGPRAEALLYAADRAHHVATVIRPALEHDRVVLTDRYLDSSVAYQSGGRELAPGQVEDLSLWASGGLVPHLTLLLDIDPVEGLNRLDRGHDRLERAGTSFHARTREAYLERARSHPDRIVIVSAAGSRQTVHGRVLEVVRNRLEGSRWTR